MGLRMLSYDWTTGRCPCCRKKTEIVLDGFLFQTAKGWSNVMSRARSVALAKEGTCPWCGRVTTIISKILLSRFEPHLMSMAREFIL
jgi:hypothetical protein